MLLNELLKYMPDRTLLDDWLRVHRLLLDQENAFTEVALRAAAGEVSAEELEREREALMGLRALCTAVYQKAFPEPPGARSGNGASSVLPYLSQGEQVKVGGIGRIDADDDSGDGGSAPDNGRSRRW